MILRHLKKFIEKYLFQKKVIIVYSARKTDSLMPASAPSRALLFKDLMPARNGAECNHTFPNPGTLKLTQKLQETGYKILEFGKTFHGAMSEL